VLISAYEKLSEAADAATFHRCLAILISNGKVLPDQWLDEIATLAAVPWKKPKGRPRLRKRQDDLEWEYFHRHLGGLKSSMPTRTAAIEDIVRSHQANGSRITPDAAAKMYDAAKKSYAEKPYAIGGIKVAFHHEGTTKE
jgi:hypothetical protein